MNTNNFGFTAKTDRQVLHKILKLNSIEEMLNSRLCIADYSNKIQEIVFVYLAASPEVSIPEKDFKKYRWKHKCLEVGVNLDYERLVQAKESEVLEILAEGYLKGIKKYMQRKDFDNKLFYKDVEKLFIKNGLLPQLSEALNYA